MEKEKKSLFERLSAINVNENTDTRDNLTYLTWSWAWTMFKREVPDATYEVRHWDGNVQSQRLLRPRALLWPPPF